MSRSVDQIIREAIERGELDNLPGKGKPIDLTDYFSTPEDLRMAYSILKNAGILPSEAQYLSEIAELEERLKQAADENERAAIRKEIVQKRLRYDIAAGR
jgi:hypothetical protein